MGWGINFVMFGMSDVTLLDPALRSHVFDESEWKKITAVRPLCRFEKGCGNKNKS
jgi:hypothetical protein